jgi:hypothetical protein
MEIGPEPVVPVYSVKIHSFRKNMVAPGDATEPKDLSFGRPLSAEEAGGIQKNETRLWAFSRIAYEDIFGNPHTHRFYLRTVMLDGECILQFYDHKHYNISG